MDAQLARSITKRAEQIFLFPCPEYPYRDIIIGIKVNGGIMKAVHCNSFIKYQFSREANKILSIYQCYFLDNEDWLVSRLSKCLKREDVDRLADEIRQRIIEAYNNEHFETHVDITSYNRTRKIIDLYFEHLVSMATAFSEVRRQLVPLLFLPLDSKMFSHEHVFEESELRKCRLKRKSKYGELKKRCHYEYLQQRLLEKAEAMTALLRTPSHSADEVVTTPHGPFYALYFDLLWSDRYLNGGGNLFETNP